MPVSNKTWIAGVQHWIFLLQNFQKQKKTRNQNNTKSNMTKSTYDAVKPERR